MNNSSHISVANPHHVSNGHHTTGGISPNSLMNTSLGKEIRFHYKKYYKNLIVRKELTASLL